MLHDTALYEKAGKPAAALVSSGFMPQAAYQAKNLGLMDAQVTFVQHPISDNTQAQVEAKAEAALESIVEQLTVAGGSPLRAIAPTGPPRGAGAAAVVPAGISSLPMPAAASGGG